MKTIKFILKTTKRVYIAYSIDGRLVYGQVEKDGKAFGRMRCFAKDKIQLVK